MCSILCTIVTIIVGCIISANNAISAGECLYNSCLQSFVWTNNTASFTALSYSCPIEDFRKNTNYNALKDYKIAIIGDSLDLHTCARMCAITTQQ